MSADSIEKAPTPRIRSTQIKLLERLCNACSVSGDENEVREIVLDEIRAHADSVEVDALGNILATRKGVSSPRKKRLRVMIAAHMDEIGFMVIHREEDGIYRFDTVGGIDVRQLAGKPVLVGHDHIPGVIGAKPIHLTTSSERKNSISLDALRIDIGLEGNQKIKLGERATFATKFTRVGPSIRAKALDDRLGVATLIELLKQAPQNIDLLAAFTVQEEIGLRGAQVAAYALEPDLGIALDSTPAIDLPGWAQEENHLYNTRLDAGPAIYLADSATLADPRLVRHFVDCAEENKLPFQFRQPGGGGTDAGAIHRSRAGVPSISISVPARYLHTAAGIARLSDWKNTLILLYKALSNINPGLLSSDR
ncbi:MAG: M42 family metallopeptidase [Anaerolineales bacterium]|jgi:endoglucanase